jgi:FkbM family methyltransferase
MSLYRAVRKGTWFKSILGQEPFHWIRTRPEVVEFGSKYGRWGIDATDLSSSSVVVCFGLGEDVTFETALIENFGCTVFGFDPTPRSVRYVTAQVNDPRFKFFPYALADRNGTITFALPPESVSDQVSASAVARYASSSVATIDVPCLTLEDARSRFAIPRIDVLKMDIEGAEFAVIEQAIANHWLEDATQVLVEFHHFLPGLTAAQTRRAISLLLAAGFSIAWIGRTNHEYLFTRKLKSAA